MHRVPRDGEALRLDRGMELLDTEQAAGVAEQLPDEPPQSGDVADAVAFHYVAQDGDVHVVAEQLLP